MIYGIEGTSRWDWDDFLTRGYVMDKNLFSPDRRVQVQVDTTIPVYPRVKHTHVIPLLPLVNPIFS
jgi:hypothetical protein